MRKNFVVRFFINPMDLNQNIANNSQKASFTGKYYIEGTKKAVDGLYNLIRKENALLQVPTDCCDFSSHAKLVLTNSDINKYKSVEIAEETGLNLAKYFIHADEILNKAKNALKKNIPLFNAESGRYSIVKPKKIDGTTYYFYETNRIESGFENSCKFKNHISIATAIEKIDFIRSNKSASLHNKSFNIDAIPDADKVIEFVKQTPLLNRLKTNRLLGAGAFSVVFDIGNNKVLKLSQRPCFPKKLESFDLPIFQKGYSAEHGIYWCIGAKAQNYLDCRINQANIIKIIDDIKANNYEIRPDLNINSPHQLGFLNGKVYLLDYDSAVNKDRSSRMAYK